MNSEVVLKRFIPTATNGPKDPSLTQITEESSWRHIRSVLDKAVKDTSSEEAKSLSVTFHKLQVNQKLKVSGLSSIPPSQNNQKDASDQQC
jgi:hypothetical protein